MAEGKRQRQIAEAALMLVARRGLARTTVARIGAAVGMEAPSLYSHFSSREEMLLAALRILGEKIAKHNARSSNPDMLERMRELGQNHPAIVDREFEGVIVPIFEFITTPRDSSLREAAGRLNLRTLQTLTEIVEEGKEQGTIRRDVDSRLVAYEWLVLYWAADVTRLMGLDEFIQDKIYDRILERFVEHIAAVPNEPQQCDASRGSG